MKKVNITIVGLGLIGGSIGLSLKAHFKTAVTIVGMDHHQETCSYAVQCGAIDNWSNDYQQAIAQADYIFLCTPVLQIVQVVEAILPYLKAGAVITDVGSTKSYLCKQLKSLLPDDVSYVAGHPMAGSERSGIQAAEKDLFRNKCYILIPETSNSLKAVQELRALLACTGALITEMDLAQHDECAAVISHVPHVVAAALVHLIGFKPADLENNLKLAGGGFRDTTRIASSNADMWADICLTNSDSIINSLSNLQSIINTVIEAIDHNDRQTVHEFFYTAKERRDALLSASLVPNGR
jgi:prephenate dehydrogenase